MDTIPELERIVDAVTRFAWRVVDTHAKTGEDYSLNLWLATHDGEVVGMPFLAHDFEYYETGGGITYELLRESLINSGTPFNDFNAIVRDALWDVPCLRGAVAPRVPSIGGNMATPAGEGVLIGREGLRNFLVHLASGETNWYPSELCRW